MLYGFRGLNEHYGEAVASEQVENSLLYWLQWSLLSIGAFDNITKGQQGRYGGDLSLMKLAKDKRYNTATNSGILWEGNRTDWCWESGVSYETQPTQTSGVWVNNSFVPSDSTGAYAHHINFPLGQVIFDSPIPATSVVQVEHSPRFVQVRRSDEPWFHQFIYGSFRPDENPPGATGIVFAENRVQFPSIVVEPAMRVSQKPFELGNYSQIRREDFLLHCMSETPWDRRRLTGLLENQIDKRFPTFDKMEAVPPLDAYGSITPSAMVYPDMCEAYPWNQTRIVDVATTAQPTIGRSLWWSTVRITCETDAV